VTGRPRIGLVLGGGGPVGHAYHCGTLRAIEEATAWDPRDADVIVGTSAGAQVAALLRAGMATHDLLARVTGADMTDSGAKIAAAYVRPDPARAAESGRRSLRPASTERLVRALRRPWEVHLGTLFAAAAPEGRVSLAPMADGLTALFGETWPVDPLWLVALRVDTGQRVVLGRLGSPACPVGTAVTASCAVPGVFAPVEVEYARYVDGGVVSPTNADVLAGEGLDLVVVVAPMGLEAPGGVGGLLRPDLPFRLLLRALLVTEVRKLRSSGTPTFVVQPHVADLAVMGLNSMHLDRMGPVAEQAHVSMCERLESHGDSDRLAALRMAAAHM